MVKSSCGFNCEKCPLYIASLKNDALLHQKIEDEYGINKAMTCGGCLSDSPYKGACDTCKIRQCCKEKQIENCGWCSQYSQCSKILFITNTNPASKEYLDNENIEYKK